MTFISLIPTIPNVISLCHFRPIRAASIDFKALMNSLTKRLPYVVSKIRVCLWGGDKFLMGCYW